MEAGALAALVVAGLAKSAGGHLAGSPDLGGLGDLLGAGAEVAGKAMGGPVETWVNRWVQPRRRQRLLQTATWLDLAGLAWAERLYATQDDLLVAALGLPGDLVRAGLDAWWFLHVVGGPSARDVAVPRIEAGYGEALDRRFVDELAELLAREATALLDHDVDDARTRALFADILMQLPTAIAQLATQVPGGDARIGRLLLVEKVLPVLVDLLARADGSADGKRATEGMNRVAQEAIDGSARDAFGRDRFEELPALPLAAVYVEPDALRGGQNAGPVRASVRAAWAEAPLVILRAPFGMGKSLTARALAVDLATEWRQDPGRHFRSAWIVRTFSRVRSIACATRRCGSSSCWGSTGARPSGCGRKHRSRSCSTASTRSPSPSPT
jgi:hypothetical protein